jgi:1,4-dihydroxy-2-naphthoyl-CoA hydrolase
MHRNPSWAGLSDTVPGDGAGNGDVVHGVEPVSGLAPREIPPEASLDGMLGMSLGELSGEVARARIPVTDRIRQRFGLVHGGAYSALAELIASEATNAAVHGQGRLAVGMENSTHFLRPVRDGTLRAEARARHRGRSPWVWDVDFHDEHGRLCATSRVTLVVRPAPADPPVPISAADLSE